MPRKAPLSARLWQKVRVRTNGCWEFQGHRKTSGLPYGVIWVSDSTGSGPRYAHRVAWEMINGPIPQGLHVCHRCDNPPCVKPGHLFLGTNRENAVDASRKGRLFSARAERNPHAALTNSAVVRIKEAIRDGRTNPDIAAEHGVHHSTISTIRTGRAWGSVQIPKPEQQ